MLIEAQKEEKVCMHTPTFGLVVMRSEHGRTATGEQDLSAPSVDVDRRDDDSFDSARKAFENDGQELAKKMP